MTTTRFTKEQLIARANHMLCVGKAFIAEHPEYDGMAKDVELFGTALASLTAEPVGYMNRFTGRVFTLEEQPGADTDAQVYVPVYTAPPATVVPDENGLLPCPCCGGNAELDYDDDNLHWISCNVCGVSTDTAYHTDVDARNTLRDVWNRRAAMLQGSQPVSNRDELLPSIKPAPELDSVAKNAESLPGNSPVIGWLRSDYNSDDKRDPNAPLFMLGSNDPSETWGVKYLPLSGNSPSKCSLRDGIETIRSSGIPVDVDKIQSDLQAGNSPVITDGLFPGLFNSARALLDALYEFGPDEVAISEHVQNLEDALRNAAAPQQEVK